MPIHFVENECLQLFCIGVLILDNKDLPFRHRYGIDFVRSKPGLLRRIFNRIRKIGKSTDQMNLRPTGWDDRVVDYICIPYSKPLYIKPRECAVMAWFKK